MSDDPQTPEKEFIPDQKPMVTREIDIPVEWMPYIRERAEEMGVSIETYLSIQLIEGIKRWKDAEGGRN